MDRYKETFETYDKLAQEYQDKFMDLDLYNDTYDRFCELLPEKAARLFEIGCGPGNITRYLLSKRPDLDITAIDMAPGMIKLARQNNPSAHFMLMDCREIIRLTEKFDGIVCGFCMPYLSKEDCIKVIADCTGLLEKEGILYFSILEGNYSNSGYTRSSNGQHKMFVYYHETEYLQKALEENGFTLESLSRKSYPQKDGPPSTHTIFIARKN